MTASNTDRKRAGGSKLRLSVALALSSVVCLFGPLSACLHNYTDFKIPLAYAFGGALALFAAGTAVVFLFLCLFRGRWLVSVSSVLICASLYLWFNGSFGNQGLGLLTGESIDWSSLEVNVRLESVALVLAFFMAIRLSRSVVATAGKICLFLLLIQGFAFAQQFYVLPDVALSDRVPHEPGMLYSSRRNVIVILLDTFTNDIFDAILEVDGSYRDVFRDFTYFRNTFSNYPHTAYAIPAILHGRMYSNEDGSYPQFQSEAYRNSLPALLQEAGYDITHGSSEAVYADRVVWQNTVEGEQKVSPEKLRYWTGKFVRDVLPFSGFRQAPLLLKKAYLNGFSLNSFYNEFVWLYRNVPFAQAQKEYPFFVFLYSPGIHDPRVVLSDMTMVRYDSVHSFAMIVEQGMASLNIVKAVLGRLKQLGVYDDSLVVVCADHGRTMKGWDGRVGNVEFFHSRYPFPLLLIKPLSARNDAMRVSMAPAMLGDIPKTVAALLGMKNDFPGENVFALGDESRRVRVMYDYEDNNFRETDSMPPITKRVLSESRPAILSKKYPALSDVIEFNVDYQGYLHVETFRGNFNYPEADSQWTRETSTLSVEAGIDLPAPDFYLCVEGENLVPERPTLVDWNGGELGTMRSGEGPYRFLISADRILELNALRFRTPGALSLRALGRDEEDDKIKGFELRKIFFIPNRN